MGTAPTGLADPLGLEMQNSVFVLEKALRDVPNCHYLISEHQIQSSCSYCLHWEMPWNDSFIEFPKTA